MSDASTAHILSTIGRFRDDLIGLREHLGDPRADLLTRLDRMEAAYATMEHDIAFTLTERNRLMIVAQSAIDESRALANQVAAMEGRVRVLAARVDTIDPRGNGHANDDLGNGHTNRG